MSEKALERYIKSLDNYTCVSRTRIDYGYNIEFRNNLLKNTKGIKISYIMHPDIEDYATPGFNLHNDFYNVFKINKEDGLETMRRCVPDKKIVDVLRKIFFEIEHKRYPVIIEKEDRKANLYKYMMYYAEKLKVKYSAPIRIVCDDKEKVRFKYSEHCGLECIEISDKLIEKRDLNTILKTLKAQMIRLDAYNQGRPFRNTDKYFLLQLEKYNLTDIKKYISVLKVY